MALSSSSYDFRPGRRVATHESRAQRLTIPRDTSDVLEVVALSSRDWRVCDLRIHEADAHRILGYVEQRDDRYEVLWMTQPMRTDVHDTLDAALRALAAAARVRRVA